MQAVDRHKAARSAMLPKVPPATQPAAASRMAQQRGAAAGGRCSSESQQSDEEAGEGAASDTHERPLPASSSLRRVPRAAPQGSQQRSGARLPPPPSRALPPGHAPHPGQLRRSRVSMELPPAPGRITRSVLGSGRLTSLRCQQQVTLVA